MSDMRDSIALNPIYEAAPQFGLLAAVVDRPGDFALEIGAADDAVDVAVLQQELAGLKTLAAARRGSWP